jgi:hypothetical protein
MDSEEDHGLHTSELALSGVVIAAVLIAAWLVFG